MKLCQAVSRGCVHSLRVAPGDPPVSGCLAGGEGCVLKAEVRKAEAARRRQTSKSTNMKSSISK